MAKELLKKVELFVFDLFRDLATGDHVYHDLQHTTAVVKHASKIAKEEKINDDEIQLLKIAAWFHDVGYYYDPKNHEEKSCEVAEKFLKENEYPDEKIEKIKSLILDTKMPHNPQDKLSQILCDADLYHLGNADFEDRNELFRIEMEKTTGKSYKELEWLQNNIDFLTEHKYFTKYAFENLEEQKTENLLRLQKKTRKRMRKIEDKELKEKKIKVDREKVDVKKEQSFKAERGVETMFRNVMRTHVEFSSMADSKANIMISVNTLILTAIIAVLARKLDSNPHLIIPTAVITLVSLVTLIYAVLVTRPKITEGTFTKDDIKSKSANLLFFGNFYRMKLEDFTWGMKSLIEDKDYLYGSMIKDFYFLGQVLGQKYRYLRICYSIFMYGLIISVIAFTVAIVLYPGGTDLGTIID